MRVDDSLYRRVCRVVSFYGVQDMVADYEEYERACERIRKDNATYLDAFRADLGNAGLSSKTIERHVENIDFFLNTYMLTYEANPMPEGVGMVGSFLGDWFIRKCMWSTPSSIKQYITSIKKFYKCMLSAGEIDASSYARLIDIIKEEKHYWIKDCEAFNRGSGSWGW